MEIDIFDRNSLSLTLPKTASDAVIAGALSKNTARAYAGDIKGFLIFIGGEQRLPDVSKDIVIAYRNNLMSTYKPATVNRKMTSVRQLLEEAVDRGIVSTNPAARVKGLKQDNNYSPTTGMTRDEVCQVLNSIDTGTLIGKRDFALWSLMVRTGLRRAEISQLRLSSIGERDGYKILTVIGKGNKTRLAKIPTDVYRSLDEWVTSAGLVESDAPLFMQLRKTGRGKAAGYKLIGSSPLTTDGIWHVIRHRAAIAGLTANITPHSTRAAFITLALKGGAALHKVQYAAGHADPRTTERYDREQNNLDDNAVDYIKI